MPFSRMNRRWNDLSVSMRAASRFGPKVNTPAASSASATPASSADSGPITASVAPTSSAYAAMASASRSSTSSTPSASRAMPGLRLLAQA